MKYRPEVDGLRAVAVLPVILFHAGFQVFSGGFVGVDVFFVISGYLITSILIGELEAGNFSIVRFYERRARRILPALYTVLLVCVPFAILLMNPYQVQKFFESVTSVIFFVSNVFFWRQHGYFAEASELQPLLHTWSLAVEEQYYLLFPIFLWIVWRFGRSRVFWSLAVVSFLSFLICEWGWRNKPDANFFLAPSRAWELLAGSIAALILAGRPQRSSNLASGLGLALILFSIFNFSYTTPFPSFYTLAPVVGTALIILFADRQTWVFSILASRPLVGVGMISYSAYLWHQPLFAFARIHTSMEPSRILMATLALLSLVLAYLTWRWVEQPFRKKGHGALFPTRRRVFLASAAGSVVFVAISMGAIQSKGNIFNRFDPRVVEMMDVTEFQDLTWKAKRDLNMANFQSQDRTKILVIGDSTSGDLLNGLIATLGDTSEFSSVTIQVGCGNLYIERGIIDLHPDAFRAWQCGSSASYFDQSVQSLISEADVVFVASLWFDFEAELMEKSWARLVEEFGDKFVAVGAKSIDFDASEIMRAEYAELDGIEFAPQERTTEVNLRISEVVGDRFVDPLGPLCGETGCRIYKAGEGLIFYDDAHTTAYGSRLLGAEVAKNELARALLTN
ncbi:acyltransferase family protein [Tropicimonas isoalkanivorans]|uniref:Peptidoglycan/LPS O-acetylase OafA/YrhL, contains acyltransferase and SGNH-hydrolase domains n=1 Tax=Tropicimonas isoalkanivorans TaxID=441112 RepID=A0A1I1QXX6_9RHOB|nr:acyltransferase family protein [Tropicimonas isoalkanivorans]SFD26837.1 Peptidoglycan/LPS O-acetylase OafA/YrhL, contains acyltransferase and SGNH-hydrolase domains [Tropicimonas isoalkanivorans]